MTGTKVKITGTKVFAQKVDEHTQRAERGVEAGVMRIALKIQREAQLKVPVDTGALKNSAETFKNGKGFDTEALVKFQTAYAIYVHENPNAYHPVGEYKFLAKAVAIVRPQVPQMMKEAMTRFGGGKKS